MLRGGMSQLLSKLTSDATKPLTRPEKILPTGPPFSHRRWIALSQPSSVPQARFRLSIGVCWASLLLGCLPHRQQWVAAPRYGLTACYVCQEMRTVSYPSKGTHGMSRPQEKRQQNYPI
jgi:hypothetical protein